MRLINRGTCNRKPDQWVLKHDIVDTITRDIVYPKYTEQLLNFDIY